MKNIFIIISCLLCVLIAFILFGIWVVGYFFYDTGFEIAVLFILIVTSIVAKLILDEDSKIRKNNYDSYENI